MSVPKYMVKLCTDNLKTYPAPYEYILYQSKHLPEGQTAIYNKTKQIEKFITKHHGEFNVISEKPYINGSNLQLRLYFNCDVVIAKELDKLIGA